MKIKKVNIAEKFGQFSDHWNPRIVGELNNQHIKLAKFHGDFVMHKHDFEDEMFMVTKGNLKMKLEDETIDVSEGEFIIIPKGTMHQPIAEKEVHVLLFEPSTTVNTGNKKSELTKLNLDHL